MLNVIAIEDSSKSSFGGGQMVTSCVLKTLHRAGHKIHLFDTRTDNIFHSKVSEVVFSKNMLISFGKIGKGSTASFNITIFEALLFPFIAILNVISILRRIGSYGAHKHDSIVYATTKKSLVYAFLLNFFGYRFIYHAHNYDSKSRFFPVYRYLLKKAECVICVSKLVKDSIGLDNTLLAYNPAPEIDSPKDRNYCYNNVNVAFVGGLIDLKGARYFLSSHELLKRKEFITYHIFGDGEQKKFLYQQYSSENVIFHGFVDNVTNILKQSIDIIVLPSILEEACPMVIIEALTLGIPVVTTNIGGQSELVDHDRNGILVDIKNPQEIAQAIEYISREEAQYKEFSSQSYYSARMFSPEVFADKILNVFS